MCLVHPDLGGGALPVHGLANIYQIKGDTRSCSWCNAVLLFLNLSDEYDWLNLYLCCAITSNLVGTDYSSLRSGPATPSQPPFPPRPGEPGPSQPPFPPLPGEPGPSEPPFPPPPKLMPQGLTLDHVVDAMLLGVSLKLCDEYDSQNIYLFCACTSNLFGSDYALSRSVQVPSEPPPLPGPVEAPPPPWRKSEPCQPNFPPPVNWLV